MLVTVVVAASGSVRVCPPGRVSVEEGRLATARELSVRTKDRSELMDMGGGRVGEEGGGEREEGGCWSGSSELSGGVELSGGSGVNGGGEL